MTDTDTLVVYKSKYGATKKYAQMLKDELGCDIVELKDFDRAFPVIYDNVIFAGGIYAGGIAGINVLRKNYDTLRKKNLAVFCVGASPFDGNALNEVKDRCLKGELGDIPLFYGRGAWDESAMGLKDRMMCRILQKAVAKQDPSTYEPWMEALMSAMGKKCDWIDRKYLEPLIDYIAPDHSGLSG